MNLLSANQFFAFIKTLMLISSFLLFSSCLDIFIKLEGDDTDDDIDTIYFPFNTFERDDIVSLSSTLESKITKLENSRFNGQLIRTGRIHKHSSKVYNAIMNKPEVYFSKDRCIKIEDLSAFNDAIYRVNYAKVYFHFYDPNKKSKVVIEELVFYTEEDCKSLFNYINLVREREYFWNSIDKYKSDIFMERNKLYYVSIIGRLQSEASLSLSTYLQAQ